jgi:hypothetical protein
MIKKRIDEFKDAQMELVYNPNPTLSGNRHFSGMEEKNIAEKTERKIHLLKMGIWAYFLLLIFEGALRKWFLPGLAAPLLIIRDPVALILIYISWKRGLLPNNPYMTWVVLIGFMSCITAIIVGHGNLPVAIYGGRILLLHFPLMFVIGNIFHREDVVKIGKILLILSIPIAILVAFQFFSPQSAWVNRGVGGDMQGAGFSGANGFFRPPGTFSFTNGNSFFYSLIACFVFYFWLDSKNINKIVLFFSTAALLIVIPLSISRGLFFQVIVTLVFTIYSIFNKPGYFGRLIIAVIGFSVVIFLIRDTFLFQTATEAFTSRFETASEHEGGLEGTLGTRYLGGMVEALRRSSDLPFFGLGIGMGTNVGSTLLTGERQFLISEEEWGRVIGELGPLLGLAIIFIRLALCLKLSVASYMQLKRGDLLPWILLSFTLTTIPQAQWAQPTALDSIPPHKGKNQKDNHLNQHFTIHL